MSRLSAAAVGLSLDLVVSLLLAPGPVAQQAGARNAIARWLREALGREIGELGRRARSHPGGPFVPLALDDDERLAAVAMVVAGCRGTPPRGCLVRGTSPVGNPSALELGDDGELVFVDKGYLGDRPRLEVREARTRGVDEIRGWCARLELADEGYALSIEPLPHSPLAWALRERPYGCEGAQAHVLEGHGRSRELRSREHALLLAEPGNTKRRGPIRLSCPGPESLLRLSAIAQSRPLLLVSNADGDPLFVVRLEPLPEEIADCCCLPVLRNWWGPPGVHLPDAPRVAFERDCAIPWMRAHGVPTEALDPELLAAVFDRPLPFHRSLSFLP